jgi:hypothetical protein
MASRELDWRSLCSTHLSGSQKDWKLFLTAGRKDSLRWHTLKMEAARPAETVVSYYYTTLHYRCRQHGPLKRWYPTTTLYSVTTQNTTTWSNSLLLQRSRAHCSHLSPQDSNIYFTSSQPKPPTLFHSIRFHSQMFLCILFHCVCYMYRSSHLSGSNHPYKQMKGAITQFYPIGCKLHI